MHIICFHDDANFSIGVFNFDPSSLHNYTYFYIVAFLSPIFATLGIFIEI